MKRSQVKSFFLSKSLNENQFFFYCFFFHLFSAWLCPVCNKTALYTDLFVDQFFIDVIGQCPSSAKAIEYEPNGQWKAVGEEKPSRRAQREREAYRAAQGVKGSNGKSNNDFDQSDDDSDDEDLRRSKKYFSLLIQIIVYSNLTFFSFSRINRSTSCCCCCSKFNSSTGSR